MGRLFRAKKEVEFLYKYYYFIRPALRPRGMLSRAVVLPSLAVINTYLPHSNSFTIKCGRFIFFLHFIKILNNKCIIAYYACIKLHDIENFKWYN